LNKNHINYLVTRRIATFHDIIQNKGDLSHSTIEGYKQFINDDIVDLIKTINKDERLSRLVYYSNTTENYKIHSNRKSLNNKNISTKMSNEIIKEIKEVDNSKMEASSLHPKKPKKYIINFNQNSFQNQKKFYCIDTEFEYIKQLILEKMKKVNKTINTRFFNKVFYEKSLKCQKERIKKGNSYISN